MRLLKHSKHCHLYTFFLKFYSFPDISAATTLYHNYILMRVIWQGTTPTI